MNKKTLKIAGWALGLSMAVAGIGAAVGAAAGSPLQVKATEQNYSATTLSDGKKVLIVSHDDNEKYYLMDAVTPATSAGPKWISIDVSNKLFSGDYDSHLFTVSASDTNWKFSTGTNYLKWSGTSSNTAIRIASEDSNNTWTYSNGTMKFSSATRYLGVYTGGTDWRSYNSATAGNYNGTGSNIEFYEVAATAQTISGSSSAYVGNDVTLTTNATTAAWTITADTAGASLSADSGKSITVRATQAGSVTVQAVAAGYTTVTHTITFNAVPTDPYITPSKTSISEVYTGQNQIVTFTYGNLAGELDVSTLNSNVTATIQNDDGEGNAEVKIDFASAGNSEVYLLDGSTKLATITVEVTASSVSITGLASSDSVYIGKTLDLGSTIEVTKAGSFGTDVTWESDNKDVASVDANGVVTGLAEGTANITVASVSDPNVSMTCTVTVSEATVYTLVTDASDLVPGTKFILAHATDDEIAIGAYTSTYFTTTNKISIENSGAISDSAMVFTLEGEADAWNIKNGNDYFGLTSSNGANVGKSSDPTTNGYTWTIDIDNDGLATMKTDASGNRYLGYNSSASPKRYAAYSGAAYTEVRLFAIIPNVLKSVSLSITDQQRTFTVGNKFAFNGTLTASYSKESDASVAPTSFHLDSEDGEEITTATTLTRAHNGKKVYVVYEEEGVTKSDSFTLIVNYDEVSSVTITESNVNMLTDDFHTFKANVNSGADPDSVITWSAVNADDSHIPEGEFEIDANGVLTTATETAGTLLVTATSNGINSVPCVVTVTGDPYVTFSKTNIQGIVGAELNNSVKADAEGLGTIASYSWTVAEGEDVVSITNESSTTNTASLTFAKAGTATLHVVITDTASKTAEGDISVEVIQSLNDIKAPDTSVEKSETDTFSSMGLSNGEQYNSLEGAALNFAFGSGANDGKYYTTGAAIRVYGGGYMTVSSENTLTKINLTFGSDDGSNAITTDTGTYSNGTWTGSAKSVTFTIGGSSGHRRIASVKGTWSETVEGTKVNDVNFKAQKAAISFASTFLSVTSGTQENPVCKDDGSTNIDALKTAWSSANDTFTTLRDALGVASDDQVAFDSIMKRAASATKETYDTTAYVLEKALARYDHILSAHKGVDGISDFIHESSKRAEVQGLGQIGFALNNSKDDGDLAILVPVVAAAGVLAAGGFAFIRRKKEDR